MREFVFGTREQFAWLDQLLADGMCHVFNGCRLPAACSPSQARLGFEKSGDTYILYIDKGISTAADDPDFRHFLETGEARFICIDDMAAFLHALQPLFSGPSQAEGGPSLPFDADEPDLSPVDLEHVVDRNRLHQLRAQEKKAKMVWPEEIAAPLKQRVFGQDQAIDALAEKVVINRMRKTPKLMAMVLVGPTATGKSETAKSLASVLSEVYGKPYGFIELAGSEFIGEHTVHRFFGAPPGYVGHGQPTVLDPVRKNPYHVIVINEIEKADVKLLTGLMEAIDTGLLGMADNSKPIDLNRCILMFTSNIPIDMTVYDTLSDFERTELCRDAFTSHCQRPEISGKIGDFLVFVPLDEDAVTNIIIKFVAEELSNYGLTLKRISEDLMDDFLDHKTKYGARGIRELVSYSIGKQLLRQRRLEGLAGHSIVVTGTMKHIEFHVA